MKRKSFLVEKMDHVRALGWGAVWFFPLRESYMPGSAENQDHVARAETGGGGAAGLRQRGSLPPPGLLTVLLTLVA